MTTVISKGTGVRAALGPGQFAAGKTGTTENSGDAWFVGFTKRWTVAVWVGYPDKLKPMLTEFAGAPVEGGTYPGADLARLHGRANAIADDRNAKDARARGLPPKPPADQTTTTTPGPVIPTRPAPVPEGGAGVPATPQATTAAAHRGATGTGTGTGGGARRRSGTGTDRPTPTPRRPTTPPRIPGAGTGGVGHRRRHQRAALAAGGAGSAASCARRPRARHVAVAARAEAPSEVDRLRDPDALADVEHRRLPAGRAWLDADRPVEQEVRLSSRPMPSACVSLPGPLHSSSSRATRRRARMTSIPSSGSSARIRTAAPDVRGRRRR